MGISLGSPPNNLLILNVYLPYDDGSNRDEFSCLHGQIDSYIEEASTPYVVVSGDFNASFRNYKNTFGKDLLEFCRNNNLGVSDVAHNSDSDRFTYSTVMHMGHSPGLITSLLRSQLVILFCLFMFYMTI